MKWEQNGTLICASIGGTRDVFFMVGQGSRSLVAGSRRWLTAAGLCRWCYMCTLQVSWSV